MQSIASPTASQIARRIRDLIASQDGGDVTSAAHRLDVPIEHICGLERLLTGHSGEDRLTLLTNVVRRYRADACWLLTGSDTDHVQELAPELRLHVVELLSAIAEQIVAEFWAERGRVALRPAIGAAL